MTTIPFTEPTLFDVETIPVLPYGGTSGWSGSETSRDRAAIHDESTLTGERQRTTLDALSHAGHAGLTWQDLSRCTGWHHGVASGALSALHRAGLIARLAERRNGCHPYVRLSFVDGRGTSPYTPNLSARILADVLRELDADLADGRVHQARARLAATLDAFGMTR